MKHRTRLTAPVLLIFIPVLVILGGAHVPADDGDARGDDSLQPSVETAAPLVGEIPSKFSVSPGGVATYKMPLHVPPGIKGVHPKLSLAYSHTRNNGRLGLGWDLHGLSAITRCPRNLAVDGIKGGVSYDASDRFCLDGQRLIVTDKTYGADGSQYHTEIESWKTIVANGTCGSGPCSFQVTAKHGTVTTYGLGSGKILVPGRQEVRVWAQNQLTDRNGNRMTIEYTTNPLGCSGHTNENFYPLKISYTSNAGAHPTANRSVGFAWEARQDIDSRYRGGVATLTSARLKSVTTSVGDTVVLDYRLSYEAPSPTACSTQPPTTPQRSRLASVQVCDATATTAECLTGTTFGWQSSAAKYDTKNPVALKDAFGRSSTISYDASFGLRNMADVDGDGRTDIVGFSVNNGVQVALSDGTQFVMKGTWYNGFDHQHFWSLSGTPRTVQDVNGDGMADLVGFNQAGVQVALSNGKKFTASGWTNPFPHFGSGNHGPPGTTPWDPKNNPRILSDVNGDGRADIVGFSQNDGVWVSLVNAAGTGFETPTKWSSGFSNGWAANTPRFLTDVTGDGLADIVGVNVEGVTVAISNGRDAFITPSWATDVFPFFGGHQFWSLTTDLLTPADVNGDGLADLVGSNKTGVFVAIATGQGFLKPCQDPSSCQTSDAWTTDFHFGAPPWTLSQTPLYTVDVNADGRSDLVGFGPKSVLVALSTGSSFESTTWDQTPLANTFGWQDGWPATQPRRLADVDGDGLADIVAFGQHNVQLATAAGPYPDLMTTATDGLGKVIEITYAPISDSQVYSATVPPDGVATGAGTATQSVPALMANSLSSVKPYSVPVSGGIPLSEYAPQEVLGGHLYVTAGVRVSNDPQVNAQHFSYHSSYHYAAAENDRGGHGWLGYRNVQHTDGETGRVTSSTYYQPFPKTRHLSSRVRSCGTTSGAYDPRCTRPGLLLGAEIVDLEAPVTATGTATKVGTSNEHPKCFAVRRKTLRRDHYAYGKSNWAFSLGQQWSYDVDGNVQVHGNLGYVDRTFTNLETTDDVYTLTQYVGLPDRYKAFPQYRKVSSSSSMTNISKFVPTTDLSMRAYIYNKNSRQPCVASAIDQSDSPMNLRSLCRWDETNKDFLEHAYGYDAFGNRTSNRDPAGNTTTKVYDVTYHTYLERRTSPQTDGGLELVDLYSYDPRFGHQVASIGPNGAGTAAGRKALAKIWCYDNFGRVAKKQGPVPEKPAGVQSSTNCAPSTATKIQIPHAAAFDVTTAEVVTLETSSMASSEDSIYHEQVQLKSWPKGATADTRDTVKQKRFVDALGRIYRQTEKMPGDLVVIATTHDSSNKVLTHSLPYFMNAQKYFTTFKYDIHGRVLEADHPLINDPASSSKITHTYELDSKGTVVTQTREAASGSYVKVLKHQYFNGKPQVASMQIPGDRTATTKFGYDRLGRATSATDPAGSKSTSTYDSLGRHATTNNPAQGTVTFFYDVKGRMFKKSDAQGDFYFCHDPLGRLTRQYMPKADRSLLLYSYDSAAASNGLGRRTGAEKATFEPTIWPPSCTATLSPTSESSYLYGFDRYGNRSQTALTIAATPSPLTWTYHDLYAPDGAATQHTYPDSTILERQRQAGQLQHLLLGGAAVASFSGYTAQGQAGTILLSNGGLTETHTYSPVGQMVGQSVVTSNHDKLLDLTYHWDELSMLKQTEDSVGTPVDFSHTYAYENLRLTIVDGEVNYRYDTSGNMTQKDDIAYTYHGHQVTQGKKETDVVFSAQYDPAGNMKSKTSSGTEWSYGYDSRNHLLSAVDQTHTKTTQFVYDHAGRRVEKTAPDGTVTFYVEPLYTETHSSGGEVATTRYASGDAAPLARLLKPTTTSAAKLLYFHRNHLSSVVMTSNASGQAQSYVTYTPYGEPKVHNVSNFRSKFDAKELDASTGLYDFGARYYDPQIGHFLTADNGLGASKTRADAFNRYEFVLGAPTVYTDPSGRLACAGVGKSIVKYSVGVGVGSGVASGTGAGFLAKNAWAGVLGGGGFGGAAGITFGVVQCGLRETARIAEIAANAAERSARAAELVANASVAGNAAGGSSSAAVSSNLAATRTPPSSPSNVQACGCFAADTLIATETGLRVIQDILPGDRVWSRNAANGQVELKAVLGLQRRPGGSETQIRLRIGGQLLIATPGHPFWSETAQGWKSAGELEVGEILRARSGEGLQIEAAERLGEAFATFNFEVVDNNNYFVGASQVLVHNVSACQKGRSTSEDSGSEDSGMGEENGLGGETELGSGEIAEGAEVGEDLAAAAEAETAAAAAGAAAAAAEAAADEAAAVALLAALLAL